MAPLRCPEPRRIFRQKLAPLTADSADAADSDFQTDIRASAMTESNQQ